MKGFILRVGYISALRLKVLLGDLKKDDYVCCFMIMHVFVLYSTGFSIPGKLNDVMHVSRLVKCTFFSPYILLYML